MTARRVQQLIALATDPGATEEEARTAALAACRGIRNESLAVVSGPESGPFVPEEGAAEITPRTRQLTGQGAPTPAVPRRAAGALQASQGDDGVHILDWNFEDRPKTGRSREFAFPQHFRRR